MNSVLPSVFQPQLTVDRLTTIANWFLEELYATEDDLVRNTDSPYTLGTTRFGRQKSRIVIEFLTGNHNWLGLQNAANDLVFTIEGIPCRFSNDNASSPTKSAVLEPHRFQMPLIEAAEPGQAVRFCFVIDRGPSESEEPRVELLGFASNNDVVCRWRSNSLSGRPLVDVKRSAPQPVEIAKPIVAPKRRDSGDEANAVGT